MQEPVPAPAPAPHNTATSSPSDDETTRQCDLRSSVMDEDGAIVDFSAYSQPLSRTLKEKAYSGWPHLDAGTETSHSNVRC